jgi:hypothetical protein
LALAELARELAVVLERCVVKAAVSVALTWLEVPVSRKLAIISRA